MKISLLFFSALLFAGICNAQLQITTVSNGQALAQRLVGTGVSISNVVLTGDSVATGFFKNIANTNINLDSGVVLTNGRAKTVPGGGFDDVGLDGDGTFNDFASLENNPPTVYSGDSDLAAIINTAPDSLHDATILEFDFVPTGDSVQFRYVFSSEEYPVFACPSFPGANNYNDAFAFFIQGPNFPVKTNIALIPGSSDPVTINNINDQGCALYPQYYVNNEDNVWFNHNGHTNVFTALAQVQPCQTYHLKLVIADVADGAYDSGVFLEAKSFSSNEVQFTNLTQTDADNNSYVVEGCAAGAFTVKRPNAPNFPLVVNLSYAGTAINGVDVQTLPSSVTIPANDSIVTVNVIPLIDNIAEGIEYIKVTVNSSCGSAAPIDSTVIQIRDYDTLTILPGDTVICKQSSVQLVASSGNSTFQWDPTPGLSNYTINNPVATPGQDSTTYYCTATVGTCNSRDSVLLRWKDLEFLSQVNVNCHNGATGQINVSGGAEWTSPPVQYSINTLPGQPDSTFNNLPVGTYVVHITDASGCADSLPVNIIQAYPTLLIADTAVIGAGCGSADGSITVAAQGGLPPYQYSVDGTTFQTANIFTLPASTYTITIKDSNNCTALLMGVVVPFSNGFNVSVTADTSACAGQPVTLAATGTADNYTWSPSTGLNATNGPVVVSTATDSITYTVSATLGSCSDTASVTVSRASNLSVDAGPALIVQAGATAQIQAVVTGGNTNLASILWTPATDLSAANILNPVITPSALTGTSTYLIKVVNTSGCFAEDQLQVTVVPDCINLKNAFSPNGDGINDLWSVYDDFSCLKNISLNVFNRYGSKVYDSKDYRNGWDGKFKGKPLPDGTYYAVINFTFSNGKTMVKKTDITLVR